MNQTIDLPVTITVLNFTETGLYAQATCGKISACVCITDAEVRVIVQNSAHKVWRKSGRGFDNVAEALAAYKSPSVKAIIAAVDRRNT